MIDQQRGLVCFQSVGSGLLVCVAHEEFDQAISAIMHWQRSNRVF
jgi:hypothetical protein